MTSQQIDSLATGITPARSINSIQIRSHERGIRNGMPRAEYDLVQHLNTSSLAAGFLDHQEIDPAAIKFAFENPHLKQPTAASQDRMDRGTLAHMLLLQPERMQSDVAIWTGARRAGNGWESFQAENLGKLIVREEDWESVNAAVSQFRFSKAVNQLLTELDAEVAMFSREHSFYVKGMIDAVTRGPVCRLIDIKTTEAGIDYKSVERTIRDFRYREKLAAYKRWLERESGREVVGCYCLFLSMTPPYAVRAAKMSTMALEWGEERIVAALDSVQRCLDDGAWPMFAKEDVVLVQDWELDDREVTLDFDA